MQENLDQELSQEEENELNENSEEEIETEAPEEDPEENSSEAVTYEVDLTNIESLLEAQNDMIQQNMENTYRLYYFFGGLYVVFFIVLAIKFFKQFF